VHGCPLPELSWQQVAPATSQHDARDFERLGPRVPPQRALPSVRPNSAHCSALCGC
jgi:hypothetical protein